MPPLIRVAQNAFKEVEKRAKYAFSGKEAERDRRTTYMADLARSRPEFCPLGHDRISMGKQVRGGRGFVCLSCGAAACEDEIKDMGYDYETVPIEIIDFIFDEDLTRQGR